MTTREQVDLYLGHPGFSQQPTPRPVSEDTSCGDCRHPRWMHAGSARSDPFGSSACRCVPDGKRRCGCLRFVNVPS